MKVCLVGNGPTEVGTGNGKLIDSFDKVYRCNNFVIGGYEDDYGSKIDVWVNTFARDIKYPEFKKGLEMFCPLPLYEDSFLKIYTGTDIVKYLSYRDTCNFIELKDFRELIKLIPNPSCGMSMIWNLYKKNLLTEKCQIFGFSFFEKGKQHYFEKGVQTRHNGSKEKDFINEILN